MLPLAVAAGLSLLGGVLGNRSRSKEADKNRRFQERMRNTSWQAGVADMEKAGLNPALAYTQGGAASPSGSMASQDDVISGAVSSAMDAKRLKSQLANDKGQRELMYNQAKLAANSSQKEAAQVQLIERNQRNVEIQNEIAILRLPQMIRDASVYSGKAGNVISYTNAIRQALMGGGGLGSLVGGVAGAYVGSRSRQPRPMNLNRNRVTTMQRR